MSLSTNLNSFLKEALNNQYTKEELEKQIPALGILPNKINVYIKITGNITNDVFYLEIHDLKIQGISINSYYDLTYITDYIQALINDFNAQNNTTIQNAEVSNKLLIIKIN